MKPDPDEMSDEVERLRAEVKGLKVELDEAWSEARLWEDKYDAVADATIGAHNWRADRVTEMEQELAAAKAARDDVIAQTMEALNDLRFMVPNPKDKGDFRLVREKVKERLGKLREKRGST